MAFSLAGHKNRLQIFPVPGEIHKPPRVDEVLVRARKRSRRRDKMVDKNYVGADA